MPRGKKLCISQYWIDQLGKMPDGEIAKANNLSRSAICRLRKKLGISKYSLPTSNSHIDWKRYDYLLGTIPDGKLAKMLGCSRSIVVRRRYKLNIDCYQKKSTLNWKQYDQKLGKLPDTEIARAIGCNPGTVWRRRQDKNILPFYAQEFAKDLNHV